MRFLWAGLAVIVLVPLAWWAFLTPPAAPTPDASPKTLTHDDPSAAPAPPTLPAGVTINFVDATAAAGIDFHHVDGRTEMEHLMDSTGSGAAWLDYDRDGLLDLFLVQGHPFVPPYPAAGTAAGSKLYRNLGGGKFQDVTSAARVGHVGCGQGAAVGDYDNDGFPDLFVTCYGKPNVLYHNVPDGKGGRAFEDVTATAGMATHPDWKDRPNWSTSAAFLDFDNDGLLDLFVCSYVHVDLANYPVCLLATQKRAPCSPQRFKGTVCVLYRNQGNGTFADVTKEAGVNAPNAKGLGVVALDLDDDGLIDIFVANDGVPNFLFRNLGGGTFDSLGPACGCLVNGLGNPQAYMGVAAGDLDGDGRPDLFSTTFAQESKSFFRNLGKLRFYDATNGSGLGPPSWHRLGFGVCAPDLDRDGSLDLVVANGHVKAHVDLEGNPTDTFRQPPLVFLNDGRGRFRDFSTQAGPAMQKNYVGRALALADYDNDGRVDLYLADSGGSATLLHNEGRTPHHWIRLELVGTKSARDAVGAKVTLTVGDRKLVRHREAGGSYLSAHDPRLLVGLGSAQQVDRVEIRWPSGLVQSFGPLAGDQGHRLTEGAAAAERTP